MSRPGRALAVALCVLLAIPVALAREPTEPLLTQGCALTPAQWGAAPVGGGGGELLHDNFAEVFADGLAVGPLRYRLAQDLTDALPADGDPLLAGALALALNLAFGAHALLDGTIDGLAVASENATLDGATPARLLALAGKALDDPERSTRRYADLVAAMSFLNGERAGCADAPARVPSACPWESMDLDAKRRGGAVWLSWDEADGVEAYRLYRSDQHALARLATVPDTMFVDDSAGDDHAYAITVIARGIESEVCAREHIEAPAAFPLGLAVSLVAVGAFGAVGAMRRR